MAEPKFSEGDSFDTPDGEVTVTEIYSLDPIKYSVRYEEVVGKHVSTLSEAEIENNDEISEL